VRFSLEPEDSDESRHVITTSPRDAFSSTYTRCQRNDIITRRHVAIGMPRQAIAPVHPLRRRASRFAVVLLDMEKFTAAGATAPVSPRVFLLLLLLQKEKKKEREIQGFLTNICALMSKSFLPLTRTRSLNGALPRESPITETRHCAHARTHTHTHARVRARARVRTYSIDRRAIDREIERSRYRIKT